MPINQLYLPRVSAATAANEGVVPSDGDDSTIAPQDQQPAPDIATAASSSPSAPAEAQVANQDQVQPVEDFMNFLNNHHLGLFPTAQPQPEANVDITGDSFGILPLPGVPNLTGGQPQQPMMALGPFATQMQLLQQQQQHQQEVMLLQQQISQLEKKQLREDQLLHYLQERLRQLLRSGPYPQPVLPHIPGMTEKETRAFLLGINYTFSKASTGPPNPIHVHNIYQSYVKEVIESWVKFFEGRPLTQAPIEVLIYRGRKHPEERNMINQEISRRNAMSKAHFEQFPIERVAAMGGMMMPGFAAQLNGFNPVGLGGQPLNGQNKIQPFPAYPGAAQQAAPPAMMHTAPGPSNQFVQVSDPLITFILLTYLFTCSIHPRSDQSGPKRSRRANPPNLASVARNK